MKNKLHIFIDSVTILYCMAKKYAMKVNSD